VAAAALAAAEAEDVDEEDRGNEEGRNWGTVPYVGEEIGARGLGPPPPPIPPPPPPPPMTTEAMDGAVVVRVTVFPIPPSAFPPKPWGGCKPRVWDNST